MTSTRRTVASQLTALAIVLAGAAWWTASVGPPLWLSLIFGPVLAVVSIILGAALGGLGNGRYRRARSDR